MTNYLFINRDGSEIISDLPTNAKCGEEEIINEDGTKSIIHYRLKDGELRSWALINGYGKLGHESRGAVGNVISAGNKVSDIDPKEIYYFDDVSDKFPPSYDKLDKWDVYYMGKHMYLPKGSIKRLIGRELSFDEAPYKLKDED